MQTVIVSPRHRLHLVAATCACLVLAVPVALPAQGNTGTITGRVLNAATGQYLRNAVVAVAGTNISTVAESGGAYTLSGVPAGVVRVTVAFAGLDPAEAAVAVGAGQTVTNDFTMSSRDDGIVKLDVFRVVTEREGNYKAIQEQKAALEIKTVIASDAFGDVSEGNVGEFLKLMPGVMMDYVDADVRTVSIGGMDPKYAVILMDGAPVASAGSSNIATGRAFEFEQLSISSIETVELSKTPTPNVAGSALAGVVNLRSKGAFDLKGRQVRWSTSAQINSHHLTLKRLPGPDDRLRFKFQPNVSLEFSDVFHEKVGVLLGYNFARTFVEQNIADFAYAFNPDAGDNATEIPRLNTLFMIDAPKMTDRANYNARLDFKIAPSLTAWVRADYNSYKALNYQRNVTLQFLDAVNAPTAGAPAAPGVEYSLNSQTTTLGRAQLHLTSAFNKNGSTTTLSAGTAFKRGAFHAEAMGQMSRATNTLGDLDYGFFNGGSSPALTNLGLRWDRNGPGDAGLNVTQLTGADWRNPASYAASTGPNDQPSYKTPINSKDQKWTAKADFRYDWRRWGMPVLLKWGGDISLQVRNVNRGAVLRQTYLGPDGLAASGDERWTTEPHYRMRNLAGGNLQDIPVLDRFAMGREYNAHPERFVPPTPAALLLNDLRTHWDVKEQIDSLYQQTIFKISKKFDLAPGVRLEQTRGAGRGPTDRGDDYAKRVLTGNPNAAIPTTSLDYIQARYGSDATNHTDYHTWLKYLHATCRLPNGLVVRASFNDSITRPNLDNLAGGVTINPDATPPTARIPNPTLRPEHGRNLFGSVEYYFPKGAGFFTLSGARRDISDLIRNTVFDVPVGEDYVTNDDLDLGGHRVTTSDNVGKAHVTSGELSYRQNLVFLPGFWRRVSLSANYTRLHFDHYENFRRPKNLLNGGISFDYRGLALRWNAVWVPRFRRGGSPANGWREFEGERLNHDLQLSCRLKRYGTVFLSGRNIFNRPQRNFAGPAPIDILRRYSDYGAVWNLGIRGQF